MIRKKIEGSSNIAEIGYDKEEMKLQVMFHGGAIYDYWPVTEEGYLKVRNAESVGSAFHKYIKSDKSISYQKVG